MFGFLNINKPKGMTSHDVVAKLRKICKIRQIGHTGTLDPLAQGVLPIAIGKATRLIDYLGDDKAYIAELQFGKISDTYDIEGVVEDFSDKKITGKDVKEALKQFCGEIEQIPPAYSAVHYKGKRLYELARSGIIPDDIPKRKVFVSKCELTEFDYEAQSAKINVECSKGTYIRSIINDLGINLDCGAVMTGLLRTKSSGFTIENTVTLEELENCPDIEKYLINPLSVISYKKYQLSDEEFEKIRHGMGLKTNGFEIGENLCLVYNSSLCAISEITAQSQNNINLTVKKVFTE